MVNFLFMHCLSLHLLVNSLHKMDISLRWTLGAGPVKMSDLRELTVLNICPNISPSFSIHQLTINQVIIVND